MFLWLKTKITICRPIILFGKKQHTGSFKIVLGFLKFWSPRLPSGITLMRRNYIARWIYVRMWQRRNEWQLSFNYKDKDVLKPLMFEVFIFLRSKKRKHLFILLPSPPAYSLKSHKSCFILIRALWLCWHLPHYCNVLVICKNYKRQIDWFPTFQITFCPPTSQVSHKNLYDETPFCLKWCTSV